MAFTKCAPGMGTRPRFVRVLRDDDIECMSCGSDMPLARVDKLGISTCLACSKAVPVEANMALHKQPATYTHNINVISENQYGKH